MIKVWFTILLPLPSLWLGVKPDKIASQTPAVSTNWSSPSNALSFVEAESNDTGISYGILAFGKCIIKLENLLQSSTLPAIMGSFTEQCMYLHNKVIK